MNKKFKALYLLSMLVFVLSAFLFVGCGAKKITRQSGPIFNSDSVVVDHEQKTITVTRYPDKPLEYSKDNGEVWQSENTFTDLTIGTTYQIVIRYAEDEEYYASPKSSVVSVTIKEVINKPAFTDESFTFDTSYRERLTIINNTNINDSNLEYRTRQWDIVNNRWLQWNSWYGISFNRSLGVGLYQVELRIKENDTQLASPSSDPYQVKIKTSYITNPGSYGDFEYDATCNSITITSNYVFDQYSPSEVVAEFAISKSSNAKADELEWTVEKVFSDLEPDTEYYFYVRWRPDEYHFASNSINYGFLAKTSTITRDTPVLDSTNVIADIQTGTVTINLDDNGLMYRYYPVTGEPTKNWTSGDLIDLSGSKRGIEYYLQVKYVASNGYSETEASNTYIILMPKLTFDLTWDENYFIVDEDAGTITFTEPTGSFPQDFLYYKVAVVGNIGAYSESNNPYDKSWTDGHIYKGLERGKEYEVSAIVQANTYDYEVWKKTYTIYIKASS